MLNIFKFFQVILLSALTLTVTHAQERGEIPNYRVFGVAENAIEENQIEQLVNDYKSGWRELNAKTLISLHTIDTEWTNAFARIFQNAQTLEEFFENRLFPQFKRAQRNNDGLVNDGLIIDVISLRYLGDDAAVIHLYTEIPAAINMGNTTRRTHFHLVAQQSKSEWKIAHTAIMDAR